MILRAEQDNKENHNPNSFNRSENNTPTKKNPNKKIKLTPDLSLSFATIGSKKVQVADEDPTIPNLEKTPDGKAYIAVQRPHRSKQSKRVIPGIELLSK